MQTDSVSSELDEAVYINNGPSGLKFNPKYHNLPFNVKTSTNSGPSNLWDNIEEPEINLLDRIAPVIQSYMESQEKISRAPPHPSIPHSGSTDHHQIDGRPSEYLYHDYTQKSHSNAPPEKPIYQVSKLFEIYSKGVLGTKAYGLHYENKYSESTILNNKMLLKIPTLKNFDLFIEEFNTLYLGSFDDTIVELITLTLGNIHNNNDRQDEIS